MKKEAQPFWVLLIFSSLVTLLAGGWLYKQAHFKNISKSVFGTIKEFRFVGTSNGKNMSRLYQIKIQYTTLNGQTLIVTPMQTFTDFNESDVGKDMQLFYDPQNPTWVELERGVTLLPLMGTVAGLLVVFFTVIVMVKRKMIRFSKRKD